MFYLFGRGRKDDVNGNLDKGSELEVFLDIAWGIFVMDCWW